MAHSTVATLPRGKWSLTETIPPTAGLDDVFVEQFCPVQPAPALPQSLHPAPPPSPPVIIHLVVPIGLRDDTQTTISLLTENTYLSAAYVTELAEFGAIYLRVGIPNARTSPRASRITRQQADKYLPSHTMIYARVYANPKRHSSLTDPFILDERGDVVAVFKPAGLPVAASCDNARECVLEELRRKGTIVHICTRLDVGTSGVLICCKSHQATGSVNKLIASARKTYVVLCRRPPPLGPVRHLYNKRARLGRGKLVEPILREWHYGPWDAGWVWAELVVLQVEKLLKGTERRWEATVHLITGRTHQIRVQFAALGCAVEGDCKYEEADGKLANIGEDDDVNLGDDPVRLGLHAKSISLVVQGEDTTFDAGEGWWRKEGWVTKVDSAD